MTTDARSRPQIRKHLSSIKKRFRKLGKFQKKLFDKEGFVNPYADTRILCGDSKKDIKRILIGIDIEVGEVLLADRLARYGKPIDLILAHHPEGKALAGLDEVMGLQADILHQLGIDYSVAKDLMDKRVKEVARRLHAANHTRSVDAARLLNFPLMCCHTPSDNHVAQYLQNMMDQKKPKTLSAAMDILLREPEYRDATANKAGPTILIGKNKDKTGKIVVDMTGGTEGSKEIFGRISQAGVKTLLCMHLSEDHFNKIQKEYINVIIDGHIDSDNL